MQIDPPSTRNILIRRVPLASITVPPSSPISIYKYDDYWLLSGVKPIKAQYNVLKSLAVLSKNETYESFLSKCSGPIEIPSICDYYLQYYTIRKDEETIEIEKTWAIDHFKSNAKYIPPFKFLLALLTGDLFQISQLASENEFNSQVYLIYEYIIRGYFQEAFAATLTLLKIFGFRSIYNGIFIKTSAWILIAGLIDLVEENEIEGFWMQIKMDLVLGEEFLNLIKEKLLDINTENNSLLELLNSLDKKKQLRSSSFLYSQLLILYEKDEILSFHKLEEALQAGHEISLFFYWKHLSKEDNNLDLLEIIPIPLIKKLAIPELLNSLGSRSIIDLDINEAFKIYKGMYLLGDYSTSGLLFQLCWILDKIEDCFYIVERMKKMKISLSFTKEIQLLCKLNKKKEAYEIIKQNFDNIKMDSDCESRYIITLTSYFLGKCTDDLLYYEICLFLCLAKENLDLFSLFLISKLVSKGIIKNLKPKKSQKILRLMSSLTPSYHFEYIAILFQQKHQKTPNKSKKINKDPVKTQLLSLLQINEISLKASIIEKIRNRHKNDLISPQKSKTETFFYQFSERCFLPSLIEINSKYLIPNLEKILIKNSERLENHSDFHKINADWLFDFIYQQKYKGDQPTRNNMQYSTKFKDNIKNEQNIKESNDIISEINSPDPLYEQSRISEINSAYEPVGSPKFLNLNLKEINIDENIELEIYTIDDLKIFTSETVYKNKQYIIKSTGQRCEINTEFNNFYNENLKFIKNNFFYQPFSLRIYGILKEYEGINVLLTEPTITNLSDYLNAQFSLEQKLCLSAQLTYFSVICNISGLLGVLLYKDLLYLTEDNILKLAPLGFLSNIKQKEIQFERAPPELWVENKSFFTNNCIYWEKMDSWALSTILFKIVFGIELWEIYKKDEKFEIVDFLNYKINSYLITKEDINIAKIHQKTKKVLNPDEVEDIHTKEEIEISPLIQNNEINESVPSIPASPLKSPKKTKYNFSPYHNQKSPLKNVPEKLKSEPKRSKMSLKSMEPNIRSSERKEKSEEKIDKKKDEQNTVEEYLKKDDLEIFLLKLIQKATSLEHSDRPSTIEIFLELNKFYKSKHSDGKGVFEYVPKSLQLYETINSAKTMVSYGVKTKDSKSIHLGNCFHVFENKDNITIKTPIFTIIENKQSGKESFIHFKKDIFFKGNFKNNHPKEGEYILCNKERPFSVAFESKSIIPLEESLKLIENQTNSLFNKCKDEILAHESKPYFIDICNNHYICDFDMCSFPCITEKRPLIMQNLFKILIAWKEKAVIFDLSRFLIMNFDFKSDENEMHSKQITVFDLFKKLLNCPKVSLNSLGGFSFNGDFLDKEPNIGNLQFNNNNKLEIHGKTQNEKPYNCKLTYPNGDYYEGEVLNGRYHGKGIYHNASNCRFQGVFENDIFVGGIIWFYNNSDLIKYEGEVQFDSKNNVYLKHGKGKLFYQNGDIYEGDFQIDCLEGKGIMNYNSNKTYYQGEWRNNLKEGIGFFKGIQGESYEGAYKAGKRHGFGKETYRNGDIYEGDFNEGQRHGSGIYLFWNGGYYQGEFNNDLKHGDGILKTKENEKFVVKFYKDRILRQTKIKNRERESPNVNEIKNKKKGLSFV